MVKTRTRKMIGLFASALLLLHAAAVVRHHNLMLTLKLDHQTTIASLLVICHGNGGTTQLDPAGLPFIPEPTGDGTQCPVCMGICGAVAILPDTLGAVASVTIATSERVRYRAERIAERIRNARPPTRGPPLDA